MNEVVIVSALRTPIGSLSGTLSSISAPKFGSIVIKEVLNQSGLKNREVDQVILGNVVTAGTGQAPARQAAIYAGLHDNVDCLTINKVCGSGMKAVMLGVQEILTGSANIVIAGGMESMSNAPYILPNARKGYKLGNNIIQDSIITDGLWDVYNNFHMGNAAEICSRSQNISREEQDQFAIESYKRSQHAITSNYFKNEIVDVTIEDKNGKIIISQDEEPFKVKFDKINSLKPAFEKNGTVTAANSSKINDGAAALLLMSHEEAKKRNLKPIAKILGFSSHSRKPEEFTIAPTDSTLKLLKKLSLTQNDFDLFEINEAFSVVALANMKLLNLSHEKVNVNGGAVSLGHPIGASGARILVTLINALQTRKLKRGLASICIGGGEATSLALELLN
ncbi:MAG: thiolase family protein [Bacteroidetes bacterium]|nr:thiolase family protein [Bacteroidota bacterium]